MFVRDLIFLLIFGITSASSINKQCPKYQVHFEKILGYRPLMSESPYELKILHKSYQEPSVINIRCMELCKNKDNCDSYVLNFNKSECYGFGSNERFLENLNYRNHDDNEIIEDHGVVFFAKTCLTVPLKCKSTLWPVLRIPGASLAGRGFVTINKLLTRRECIERCFFETSFKCRSISFHISQRNNLVRMGLANILNKDVLGRCTMNREDKNMDPESFRIASLNEEYMENNCYLFEGEKENFLDDLCAYEHFPGSGILYAEKMFINLDDRQCQEKCFKEDTFFCKGITFQRFQAEITRCFIHSEDVISIGTHSLIAIPNAYYLKRVQCLNLSVRCTQADMIIRYNPRTFFQGRIYAENHPENCAVTGSNHGPTFLKLPLDPQICGVNQAFDYESPNRTLLFVYIIIQQNPLVQLQSDRYIKVGCISHMNEMPDISLETSMAFYGKDFEGDGTLVIDKDFEYPKINVAIVDPLTEKVVKEARIGQLLKFIISMESHFEVFDLRAVNLTASSGFEHLNLINPNGCPINSDIFPVMLSEKLENSRRLVNTFKAFKFASSSQIKFNVKIQFCYVHCTKVCGNGIFNRKKRDLSVDLVNKSSMPKLDKIIFPDETTEKNPASLIPLDSVKFPEQPQKLMNIRTNNFGNPQGIQQYFGNDDMQSKIVTVPLEITLEVYEPIKIDDDRFIVAENDQIFIGSLASPNKNICLDQSLIIAILIFWLIFQMLIIFGCCIMVQRYKKMRYDDVSSYNNSGLYPDSLENRHVRWADHQRSIHDNYFQ